MLMDSVYDLLQDCTVRIEGTERGTGFLVSPGKLLTCAHVVKNANLAHLQLRWRGAALRAIALEQDAELDLALLKLEVSDHPCVWLKADIKPHDKLYSYGYPDAVEKRDGTSLTMESTGFSDNRRLLTLDGENIRAGFSGAPVLNERSLGVCGMIRSERGTVVVAAPRVIRAEGGQAVPLHVIFERWAELETENRVFHEQNRVWQEAIAPNENGLPTHEQPVPNLSRGQQLQLEYLKEKRKDAERKISQFRQEIEATADVTIKDAHEKRLKILFAEIDSLDREIRETEQALQRAEAMDAACRLADILNAHSEHWSDIEGAYRETIRHWSVQVKQDVSTGQAVVSELKKIVQGASPYNALDEFVVHLIDGATDASLIEDLQQWGENYRSKVDWAQVREQIQAVEKQQAAQLQPALLISISRAELESAKAQEEPYYQLKAWLVEDIEIYRQDQRGYHALVQADTPEAEPCTREALIQKMTRLLTQFTEKLNRLCRNCENDPKVHVFLPMELMYSDIDAWPSDDSGRRSKLLGHRYEVVMHCAERYQDSYRGRSAWLRLWKRHQELLTQTASQVFIPGCDEDLDTLVEVLERTLEEDRKCVGLKLTQAPCTPDPCDLFYEILEAALPLVIWGRSNLTQGSTEAELDAVLASGCLEGLPEVVKRKRAEARRRGHTRECHIGHHLSLLRDDPNLDIPKKSA